MQLTDFSMKQLKYKRGMTLVELMIVLAVVAILVALAVPSFSAYIRKANRGEAQQLLMNWANNQEIWRANHTTYADDVAAPNGIPVPTHAVFTFSLGAPDPPTTTAYVLVATATGNQLKDKQESTTCSPLTLNQLNAKTPAICW